MFFKRFSTRCITLLLLIMATTPTTAQFEAGVTAYQNGLYEEAEKLWLQVQFGDEAAQAAYNLAVMYEQGYGSQRSNERIVALYKSAAERGSIDAQYNYGGLFYAGERLPKSIENAVYWWSQAANAGHAQAQYNMAVLLFEGREVDQSLQLASQWVSYSAASGYQPAIKLQTEISEQLATYHESLKRKLAKAKWDEHEMWIFHQDPQDLTLELIRTNTVQAALDFIEQANLLDLAHPFLDNGQVVVVAGSFTRERDALQAISELTPDLRARDPKAVPFASVQQLLRGN